MFENGELGKIVETKRGEVTRECRRLNNEQLYLLSAPHIIHTIKTRRTRMGIGTDVGQKRCKEGFVGKNR
jgi:hypothetical protein